MPNRLTRGKALVGALHIDVQDISVSDDLTVGDAASITGALSAGSLAVTNAATAGTLAVGGGTTIKKIVKGTGSVDFASITNGTTGSGTFTVTGAAAGDVVIVNPPALTTGLAFAGAAVTGANTVTVYAVNASAAPIDEAAATFTYVWIDVT